MTNYEEDEVLLIEKQKEIIELIVSHLAKSSESFYYDSTMNICREIHHIINEDSLLNRQQKEIVQALTPNDIQTLLSYNSNCC